MGVTRVNNSLMNLLQKIMFHFDINLDLCDYSCVIAWSEWFNSLFIRVLFLHVRDLLWGKGIQPTLRRLSVS